MFKPKSYFVNIDVVYLTYNPQRSTSNPSLEYEGNNLAGLPDLHKHYMETLHNRNLMPTGSYKQSMWYNSILQEELHEAPSGYKIQVFHWKIESGIHDAFRIKNMEFNTVAIIIGANTEYWYGINTSQASGYTKRGRYLRQFPSHKSNILNIRPSLPQCPIIFSSCNLTTDSVCNCFAKLFLSGQCLTNINSEMTLTKLNELAGIVVAKSPDDDADDDAVMQDILLFRIYMTKCSRDDTLRIKKVQSSRCKFNFKTKKYSKLTSITELEDEM